MTSVGYLGPRGSYAHLAAMQAFDQRSQLASSLGLQNSSPEFVEIVNIPSVFDSVARGDCNYGVVPIENSTEGAVSYTLDRLLEGDASIRAEVVLNIEHCLLSHSAQLDKIERVYSHPQGLAQCRQWLREHVPRAELLPSSSTSRAAQEAAADTSAAAISSEFASKLYSVPIIEKSIQDREQNATRFVVLADSDAPATGRDKTSIAFGTPDEQGALLGVLRIFDDAGINLSRIESRPRPGQLWQYVFFVDLEGHRADENVAGALERLQEKQELLKVFGSYARAKLPT